MGNQTNNIDDHISASELESYSLGRLSPSPVAALEEHLLICERCRDRLTGIEPYNFVHYTIEGPFYSRITRLRTGSFFARHWGLSLRGGKEFRSRQGARAYLARTFAQMFPEHTCSELCGPTQRAGA